MLGDVGAQVAQRRAGDALTSAAAVLDDRDGRGRGPSLADEALGDPSRGAHAHEDDDGAAQAAERGPVDERLRVPGRQVAGHDDELVRHAAVGDGDPHEPGHPDGAADPRNHLDRHARRDTGVQLLHPAAEDEGVTALEPHDAGAGRGAVHEQLVDRVLRHRPAAGQLAGVDHLDVRSEQREHRLRREVVGDDDVGLDEELAAAHGQQPRITGPAPDQGHAGGRDPVAAVDEGAIESRAVWTASRTDFARQASPGLWTATVRSSCRPTAGTTTDAARASSDLVQNSLRARASAATRPSTSARPVAATTNHASVRHRATADDDDRESGQPQPHGQQRIRPPVRRGPG